MPSDLDPRALPSYPSSRSQSKSTRVWRLWNDVAHSPTLNMALDEQAFNDCRTNDDPVLRFYSWDRPSISIGYFQGYASSLRARYSVVRRPTGGGIVLHDRDITYSVIVPSHHWFFEVNRHESYKIISSIILNSLSRFGIKGILSDGKRPCMCTDRSSQNCFSNPTKFDVLVEEQKIAGAAQKRNRKGLLHQGSIDLNNLPNIDSDKLKDSLVNEFEHFFFCQMIPYTPGAKFFSAAEKLARRKFRTAKWNRKR